MAKTKRFMQLTAFRGLNPWVLIFVGMALFHIWRQSLQDVLIFGIGAILILSQVFGFTKLGFKSQPQFSGIAIGSVVLAAAAVLFFSPRHEWENFVTLLAFVPIGIALLLYTDENKHPEPTLQELRARFYWTLWAGLFALTEFFAYVASKLAGDLSRYPTISSLLDPVLEQPLGRAVFIALWLMAGVYLFGVRRRK
jgi:hypothetical protein